MKFVTKSIILNLTVFFAVNLFCQDEDNINNSTNYIPVVAFNKLNLESQSNYSPMTGLIIQNESTIFVTTYQFNTFSEEITNNSPDKYHTFDSLFDMQKGKNQYLLLFKSSSDKPIAGGLHTFQTAATYGYSIFSSESFKLTLGGGIAIGDFGITLSNGKTCPVIPIPLIRIESKTQLFKVSLDFITSPNLDITIAPEKQFRLSSSLRIDKFRDYRDIIFDTALHYRFFSKNHNYGDFAGISFGIKNDELSFDISNSKDNISVQYYAAYGKLDLTLLQISGGYTFKGIERSNDRKPQNSGNGYFVSIQGLYQF